MNKKKTLQLRDLSIRKFTLVEITMAIAIIGIGMAGVMSLLPIGFNASRDAVADNFTSGTADQFLHVITQQCMIYSDAGTTKDGWGSWVGKSGSQTSAATPIVSATIPDSATMTDVYKETAMKPNLNNTGMMVFGDTDWNNLDDTGIYFAATTTGGTTSIPGLYYVEARSGNIVDFSGAMALWQEQIQYDSDGNGSLDTTVPQKIATRLCLEISWPFDKPYAQREKRYFVYELFNPNERASSE